MQITSLMSRQLANVCSDGARLEIVCGLIPHLGFKSLTLRQYTPCPVDAATSAGHSFALRVYLSLELVSCQGVCEFFSSRFDSPASSLYQRRMIMRRWKLDECHRGFPG